MDYVIGCDVGSQSTKAVLLSYEGTVLGEASAAYAIDYPRPVWAEQPVERWTVALAEAIQQLLATTGVRPEQVRGLGLASQVESVVPLDATGRPLRPAILWMDRRATVQCDRVRDSLGAKAVLDLTGLNLDPSHVAPKIRWVADHQPEIYERTASFMQPGSYMAYHLTGEKAIDYSNASAALLLDIQTKNWSPAMCAQFGIDSGLLPPVRPATEPLGRILPRIAASLGLATATQVVVGSGDEHAACLGAGVIGPGLVADIVGTAEPVCAVSAFPAIDATGLIETHCHAHPELWLLENPGFVSGVNYRWFRDHFGQAEAETAARAGISPYALLDVIASQAPAGSQGLIFLPCLMGATTPTWNESARGTYFGFTLAHTRAHFARAILEGSAYAVRDLTDRMAAIGAEPRELRVMGGGARSRLWNQIKADVTGLPVAVPQTSEATALGAGLLALIGIGACATLTEACDAVVRIAERFEPRPREWAVYQETYALYREVYQALVPAFEAAARFQSSASQGVFAGYA
ncbi:MAG TPA: xylulokinase [Anaerolineales bacterium]|nr:xylulokinase [Anaerolineales bacterium]